MEYNTNQEKLKLPEYGRFVQQMVRHAVAIENRRERQAYAESIISVMGNLYPQMRNVPDFRHKLWDHLAWISDYRLDIDYPFDITPKEEHVRPPRLSYPDRHIRFRHYGHLVEDLIKQLADMPAGEERNELTRLIALRMKRNLAEWKGDGIEDQKVSDDLSSYTHGAIRPDFSANPLGYSSAPSAGMGGNNRMRRLRRSF